jgi:DNA topoisomerase-3
MKEIAGVTRAIVDSVRGFNPVEVETHSIDLTDPFTGDTMIVTLRDFRSKDGSLVIPKAIAGRVMDMEEVRDLLEKRVVGPLEGFRSRQGWPFRAFVRLTDEKKIDLDWGQNNKENGEEENFEGMEPIGTHPATGLKIYETSSSFVSESPEGDKTKRFRLGRKLLNQEITREQIVKLLTEGKTELLEDFISKRTRRPFKAYLVLKGNSEIAFEFPPRAAKKAGSKGKRKATS